MRTKDGKVSPEGYEEDTSKLQQKLLDLREKGKRDTGFTAAASGPPSRMYTCNWWNKG